MSQVSGPIRYYDWSDLPYLNESIINKLKEFEKPFLDKENIDLNLIASLRKGLYLFGPGEYISDLRAIVRSKVQETVWGGTFFGGEPIRVGQSIDHVFAQLEEIVRVSIPELDNGRILIIELESLSSFERIGSTPDDYSRWNQLISRIFEFMNQNYRNRILFIFYESDPDFLNIQGRYIEELKEKSSIICLHPPDLEDKTLYENWLKLILNELNIPKILTEREIKELSYLISTNREEMPILFHSMQKTIAEILNESNYDKTIFKELITSKILVTSSINLEQYEKAYSVLSQPWSLKRKKVFNWCDIVGLDAVKLNLYLLAEKMKHNFEVKNRENLDQNMMLWGTSGCGKTLVGQAVASIFDFHYIARAGSSLKGKYVGWTEAAIHSLFSEVRLLAKEKPVILFIDEAESILADKETDSSHNSFGQAATDAFKGLLDGVKKGLGHVLVIISTNHPDQIDLAILERFPINNFITVPVISGYQKLWKYHLEKQCALTGIELNITDDEYKQISKLSYRRHTPRQINGAAKQITTSVMFSEKKKEIKQQDILTHIENAMDNKRGVIIRYEDKYGEIPDTFVASDPSRIEEYVGKLKEELCFSPEIIEKPITILDPTAISLSVDTFKDVIGLCREKALFYLIIKKMRDGKINHPYIIFLYGPYGTGKSYLVKAARTTFQSGKYGGRIHFKHLGKNNSLKVSDIDKAFNEAERLREITIIFMDEVDDKLQVPEIVNKISTRVSGINSESRVIIVFASNHPERLNPRLLERVKSWVRMDRPNEKQTKHILKKLIDIKSKIFNVEIGDINYDLLAKECADRSLRTIEDSIDKAIIEADEVGDKISTKGILEFIKEIQKDDPMEFAYIEQADSRINPEKYPTNRMLRNYLSDPKISNILNCDNANEWLAKTSDIDDLFVCIPEQASSNTPVELNCEINTKKTIPKMPILIKISGPNSTKKQLDLLNGEIDELGMFTTFYTFEKNGTYYVQAISKYKKKALESKIQKIKITDINLSLNLIPLKTSYNINEDIKLEVIVTQGLDEPIENVEFVLKIYRDNEEIKEFKGFSDKNGSWIFQYKLKDKGNYKIDITAFTKIIGKHTAFRSLEVNTSEKMVFREDHTHTTSNLATSNKNNEFVKNLIIRSQPTGIPDNKCQISLSLATELNIDDNDEIKIFIKSKNKIAQVIVLISDTLDNNEIRFSTFIRHKLGLKLDDYQEIIIKMV